MNEAGLGFGRRVAANTLHAASGRLAALVVWLVFTPYILSHLGAESFGLWSLFFAITTTMFSLDLGLHQATLRHVADAHARGDEESAGAFATLGLLVFMGIGLLWVVLALALRGSLVSVMRLPESARADGGFVILAGAVVFTLMGGTQISMATAQGHGRFDLANRSMLTVTAVHALGIPLALAGGWGLRGLVVVVGLGWIAGWIAAHAWLQRALPSFHWGHPWSAAGKLREALRYGGPMQVSAGGFALHQHMDKFLLVPLVSLAAVAPYELGYRVSGAALSLVQLLLLAAVPAAATLNARGDRAGLLELYRRGSRYVLTAAVLLFVPLAVSADRLFRAWLGSAHDDAAFVLRGLCLAGGVLVLTGMGVSVARGRGRTDIEAWFAAIVVVVHGGLSFTLMPGMGLAGALIASVVSVTIGVVFYLWRLARIMEWRALGMLLEPLWIPVVAALTASVLGAAVNRALPPDGGWGDLALVSGSTALAALAVTVVTRYVTLTELRTLIGRSPRPRPS